jgi:membrane-bound lytic murein transglycosylase B
VPSRVLPRATRRTLPLAALLCAWVLSTSSIPAEALLSQAGTTGPDEPVVRRDRPRVVAEAPHRHASLTRHRTPPGPPGLAQPDLSGIPENVLAAYQEGESRMADRQPGCRLAWYHLAGIGKVESGHARGGRADDAGNTVPHILGPVLDGRGFAAIPDTDDGRYDSDRVWDRAAGPMQFIPATWRAYAADGNDDGLADPHNLFDAALAAGRYLCSGNLDLSDPAALDAAIYRYNHSDNYVRIVRGWMDAYANGVSELPPLPPDPAEPETGDEPPDLDTPVDAFVPVDAVAPPPAEAPPPAQAPPAGPPAAAPPAPAGSPAPGGPSEPGAEVAGSPGDEPGAPAGEADPGTPGDVSNPEEPGGVEEPSDEGEPGWPIDGEGPEVPTDGGEPEIPTSGEEPGGPTGGAEPEEPTGGAEPEIPTGGEEPGGLTGGAEPELPTGTEAVPPVSGPTEVPWPGLPCGLSIEAVVDRVVGGTPIEEVLACEPVPAEDLRACLRNLPEVTRESIAAALDRCDLR